MFFFPDSGQIFTRQVPVSCATIGGMLLAQGFSRFAAEITRFFSTSRVLQQDAFQEKHSQRARFAHVCGDARPSFLPKRGDSTNKKR
jgi:hypothetical protein